MTGRIQSAAPVLPFSFFHACFSYLQNVQTMIRRHYEKAYFITEVSGGERRVLGGGSCERGGVILTAQKKGHGVFSHSNLKLRQF